MAASAVRVMIMGKTGAGKSSLGNTLLGCDVFSARKSFKSATEFCDWKYGDCHGIRLEVTDTPGVSDTQRSEETVLTEIAKSIAVASPGPHAVLMTIKFGRFTREEYDAYRVLKELFGQAITNFLIIVFTAADDMDGDTPEARMRWLQTEMPELPVTLREVLNDCNGRYYAVSNKDPRPLRNEQGQQLVRKIQELMQQNGHQYYSNDMIQDVSSHVEEILRRRRQEQQPGGSTELPIQLRMDIIGNSVDQAFLRTVTQIVGPALVLAVGAVLAMTAAGGSAGAAAGALVAVAAVGISMCSVM